MNWKKMKNYVYTKIEDYKPKKNQQNEQKEYHNTKNNSHYHQNKEIIEDLYTHENGIRPREKEPGKS